MKHDRHMPHMPCAQPGHGPVSPEKAVQKDASQPPSHVPQSGSVTQLAWKAASVQYVSALDRQYVARQSLVASQHDATYSGTGGGGGGGGGDGTGNGDGGGGAGAVQAS